MERRLRFARRRRSALAKEPEAKRRRGDTERADGRGSNSLYAHVIEPRI